MSSFIRRRTPLLVLLAAVAVIAGTPRMAAGQLWKKVQEKARERVDEKVDQAIERGLDTVECMATDSACIEKAKSDGKQVKITDGAGVAPAGAAAGGAPGTGAWVNYDFVPGDKVLFVDEFAADRVGDFPKRLELTRGNMEVAEQSGARWLRATSFGEIVIPLPRALPARFTVEFDYVGPPNEHQFIYFAEKGDPGHVLFRAGASAGEGGIAIPGGARFVANAPDARAGTVVPVRIMADGEHVKVYLGATRVANVPRAPLGRAAKIRLQLNAAESRPVFIGNIRVAESSTRLYDALVARGRVATQGILFATGSATIRPESTPTLTEIGQMLTEHPDLKLLIEGHTDDVGAAAANQELSQRRAEAVKAYLIQHHKVDAARLSTQGHGATKPAASNATPEGRQQNRRVELVKQ